LGVLGVYGMIWVRKIGCGDVKWIKLSHDSYERGIESSRSVTGGEITVTVMFTP
jgi:hypothetical protein